MFCSNKSLNYFSEDILIEATKVDFILLMARMHRICRTMKNDNIYSSTFLVYCVTAGADVYSTVFDTDFMASLTIGSPGLVCIA